MSKSKEVAVKEETSVTETAEQKAVALANDMAEVGVSASDLVIPKLMLMQNTSEYVGEEKAKLGDIVHGQTQEVLGGFNSPVEIVPLKLFKTWRIYDMSGSQPKFIRQEAVTVANEKLSWEGEEDGKPIRRDICMNFFVLIKKEIDAKEAFPVVLTFKRTALRSGQQLATHLFKMAALGRKPFAQALPLKAVKQKKDTNVWAVFEVGKGLELSPEHKAVAEEWLKKMATMSYKISEVDESEAADAQVTKPVVVGGDAKGDTLY
jgi:hypothetical protein